MLICDVNLNAVWKLTRVRVLSKVSTMGKVCVCVVLLVQNAVCEPSARTSCE